MTMLDELAAWTRLLHQHEVLAGLQAGARIGLVHRDDAAGSGGRMVVWVREAEQFRLEQTTFQGFRGGDADVMFVLDDETLCELNSENQADPFRVLRIGIRHGRVLLYFLRPKRELRVLGYEDFVELVGVPLGTCQG